MFYLSNIKHVFTNLATLHWSLLVLKYIACTCDETVQMFIKYEFTAYTQKRVKMQL